MSLSTARRVAVAIATQEAALAKRPFCPLQRSKQ